MESYISNFVDKHKTEFKECQDLANKVDIEEYLTLMHPDMDDRKLYRAIHDLVAALENLDDKERTADIIMSTTIMILISQLAPEQIVEFLEYLPKNIMDISILIKEMG